MLLKDMPSLVAFYQRFYKRNRKARHFSPKPIFLFPFWDLLRLINQRVYYITTVQQWRKCTIASPTSGCVIGCARLR
jgi:hypothetical protein